ncbi:GIY-YIG nuclease family protein [Rathayibacter oskolensis]|nr:GIY-YIG nuclease family protein [Rathayibacter oskolensis]
MSEAGSAAALFLGRKTLCGIYVLEFENGQRYVGQTRNIVSRYATHRRHHGDVVALSFAPCPPELLDECEVEEIRRQEAAHSLRNLALTGWPGGSEDLGVTVEEGRSVLLPWERGRRGLIGDEGGATLPGRFWELSRRADYDELARALGRYIGETVSDPFGTQRVLWTVSALPSTNRTKKARRLLTLSCGVLETVYVQEDRTNGELMICVNIDAPTFDALVSEADQDLPSIFAEGYDADYKSAAVAQYVFESWADLLLALDFSPFLDAAYKLNTTLMRRGGSPLRRSHNLFFANDLLHRAVVWRSETQHRARVDDRLS